MLITEVWNESWESNLKHSTRVRPQEQTVVRTLQLPNKNIYYSFPKQTAGTSTLVFPANRAEAKPCASLITICKPTLQRASGHAKMDMKPTGLPEAGWSFPQLSADPSHTVPGDSHPALQASKQDLQHSHSSTYCHEVFCTVCCTSKERSNDFICMNTMAASAVSYILLLSHCVIHHQPQS